MLNLKNFDETENGGMMYYGNLYFHYVEEKKDHYNYCYQKMGIDGSIEESEIYSFSELSTVIKAIEDIEKGQAI